MEKCVYNNTTCKCANCACNAAHEGCNHGYCINCFECEKEQKSVHNVYLCTGYEPIADGHAGEYADMPIW